MIGEIAHFFCQSPFASKLLKGKRWLNLLCQWGVEMNVWFINKVDNVT